VHYAKKAVALYKVFEFDNCEIRNVLIIIGARRSTKEAQFQNYFGTGATP
jgi:hypothetical protein